MRGSGSPSNVNAIAARSRPRRRVRLLAKVLVPLTALAGVTVAGQMAAHASTPTGMLGNTSFGETSGTPSVSACPAGTFAVGAQIWVEDPRDEEGAPQYTTGIALSCRDSSGNISAAPTAGPAYDGVGSSMCNPGDLAVGLYGFSGQVMDAIGIRCASGSGTYDAALVGGTGGSAVGPADCPTGYALTSVTVWSGDYFGLPDLYGIQGACDAADTDLAISPGSELDRRTRRARPARRCRTRLRRRVTTTARCR